MSAEGRSPCGTLQANRGFREVREVDRFRHLAHAVVGDPRGRDGNHAGAGGRIRFLERMLREIDGDPLDDPCAHAAEASAPCALSLRMRVQRVCGEYLAVRHSQSPSLIVRWCRSAAERSSPRLLLGLRCSSGVAVPAVEATCEREIRRRLSCGARVLGERPSRSRSRACR